MTPEFYSEFVKMGTNPSKFGTTYDDRAPLILGALGLAGEAAEVLEHFVVAAEGCGLIDYEAVRLELGDVLWYMQLICNNHKLHAINESSVAPTSVEPQEWPILDAVRLSVRAGNIADVFKKHLLHNKPLDLQKVDRELTAALTYIRAICAHFGFTVSDVMDSNAEKLCDRYGHDRSKWLPEKAA